MAIMLDCIITPLPPNLPVSKPKFSSFLTSLSTHIEAGISKPKRITLEAADLDSAKKSLRKFKRTTPGTCYER